MPDHARWRFLPRIAGLRHAETEVIELGHIDRVESLRAGVVEITRYVSEVVVHAVLLGEHIELIEIADALALDQARHRAARDRQRLRLHRLVFRGDVSVADDVSAPDRAYAEAGVRPARHELGRHEEDLTRRPAIDM